MEKIKARPAIDAVPRVQAILHHILIHARGDLPRSDEMRYLWTIAVSKHVDREEGPYVTHQSAREQLERHYGVSENSAKKARRWLMDASLVREIKTGGEKRLYLTGDGRKRFEKLRDSVSSAIAKARASLTQGETDSVGETIAAALAPLEG